jgi:transcriptional antiterminator RfaH
VNIGALNDHACWYAVRTKLREEDRAGINLRAWQVPTFAPKLKELRTSGNGRRYVSRPLFSRYIFAHFDASTQLHEVNYTRGVQNVVSFGGKAISVDDRIINLIKAQVGEDGFVRMDEEFKPGDKVRINSGPLANLAGIFERRVKDTDRVRLLLEAVSYQGHIEIEREMIGRVYV